MVAPSAGGAASLQLTGSAQLGVVSACRTKAGLVLYEKQERRYRHWATQKTKHCYRISAQAMKIVFQRMKVEDCRRHSRSSFPRKNRESALLDASLQRLTVNVDACGRIFASPDLMKTSSTSSGLDATLLQAIDHASK